MAKMAGEKGRGGRHCSGLVDSARQTQTRHLGYGVPSSGFGHLRVEITMPTGNFNPGDVDHAIFTGQVG